MKTKHLLILIGLTILVFTPSLVNYFSADDWFHLRVSNIGSFPEFLNFFSFTKTAQTIAFYRPLPTQVFFFVFQKLFGLNQLPYHFFVLFSFGYSLYLINKLALVLLGSEKKALITTLVYGFSVSNFTRLYFLSAFQEVSLVVFTSLCLLSYLNNHKWKGLAFFVLALLSKETAVVIPLILFVIDWLRKQVQLRRLVQYLLILVPYLYLRLFIFGGAAGETYVWNFSPLKAANTLMWYFLWSLGAPELLIDYIGSGLRPIDRFFTDFRTWWPIVLGLLISNLALMLYFLTRQIRKVDRVLLACGFLFVISLLPVLFLPQHKFALELGLPLIWFALGLAHLLPEKGKLLPLFLFFYLVLNLSMNYLTYTRHYSVGRAKISRKLIGYLSKNYPKAPQDSYFEFINDTADYGASWGSSKQVANSIGGSELFRVFYGDPSYVVYYQDFPGERPLDKKKISLSTKMFVSD
jgi:hypothetical protein